VANLAAAGDLLAEQQAMTGLTGRPPRSEYVGASEELVEAVLQRARGHLKETT
jgi:3-carboxy-cis,cis-muconate cycloisomerase